MFWGATIGLAGPGGTDAAAPASSRPGTSGAWSCSDFHAAGNDEGAARSAQPLTCLAPRPGVRTRLLRIGRPVSSPRRHDCTRGRHTQDLRSAAAPFIHHPLLALARSRRLPSGIERTSSSKYGGLCGALLPALTGRSRPCRSCCPRLVQLMARDAKDLRDVTCDGVIAVGDLSIGDSASNVSTRSVFSRRPLSDASLATAERSRADFHRRPRRTLWPCEAACTAATAIGNEIWERSERSPISLERWRRPPKQHSWL
jgi:hypothetical protein